MIWVLFWYFAAVGPEYIFYQPASESPYLRPVLPALLTTQGIEALLMLFTAPLIVVVYYVFSFSKWSQSSVASIREYANGKLSSAYGGLFGICLAALHFYRQF